MKIQIRKAVKEDCGRIIELVKELAAYEKAPKEVTVTLEHFEKSGFGSRPVWWAFVAEVNGKVEGFAFGMFDSAHGKDNACISKIFMSPK